MEKVREKRFVGVAYDFYMIYSMAQVEQKNLIPSPPYPLTYALTKCPFQSSRLAGTQKGILLSIVLVVGEGVKDGVHLENIV